MRDKGTNKIVKVIAIALLLPVGVLVPFFSIESHYGSSISAQSQDESLKQRITNYKKNVKREIKKSEQEKFKLRCEVAKANVSNMSTRLAAIQKKRNVAYGNISNKLEKLYKRLEAQAFETSKLKSDLDELYSKLASFSAEVKSYKQAVDDMKVIDCKSDPAAFIAALESARKNKTELITLVDDIRDYLTNTVKPTLNQVKKQIEAGQTVGGEKQ